VFLVFLVCSLPKAVCHCDYAISINKHMYYKYQLRQRHLLELYPMTAATELRRTRMFSWNKQLL